MTETSTVINEKKVADAFSRQAVVFDEIYSADTIIRYKRERVRTHVMMHLPPAGNILELNAGTGEDAIFFAEKGYNVHATDISPIMQETLSAKTFNKEFTGCITNEVCSYTALESLSRKGPYDLVFSNFAGLNCTDQLDKVLSSLSPLVKPNGIVTLVILPEFCLWEFLLLFKGKFKTAFRRFCGKKGAASHIEGEHFRCWYYDPSFVISHLKKDFEHLQTEGLCCFVPPSYMEGFAEKRPRLYNFLCRIENKLRFSWPWRATGDYYIISFRKKTFPL